MKLNYDNINLTLELFPHCPLHCTFCYQDNMEKFSDKYYKSNPYLENKIVFIDRAINAFKKLNLPRVDNFAFWGGELFYDLSVEYNNKMIELIETINPLKSIEIATNLMNITNPFTQYLLTKKHKYEIDYDVSFNPVGMFNDNQKKIFFNNLKELKKIYNKKKTTIFTILTEDILLNKVDLKEIDTLYNDKTNEIYFYIDARRYSDDVRKDFKNLLLNIYKRYPLCRNVMMLKDNTIKKMRGKEIGCHCYDKCSIFMSFTNDFEYIPNSSCKVFGKNIEHKTYIMDKFGCKKCPYYNRCIDVCFGKLVLNGLDDTCFQKYIFENLDLIKK